jgi:hypothetical protein
VNNQSSHRWLREEVRLGDLSGHPRKLARAFVDAAIGFDETG